MTSDDLRFALALADAADAVTTERFRAVDLRVDTKPDLTPVSEADRRAEEVIRESVASSGRGAAAGISEGSGLDPLGDPRQPAHCPSYQVGTRAIGPVATGHSP